MSLITHVIEHAKPVDYYQWIFPNESIRSGENRVRSPFSDDKTPSLMLDGTTGRWNNMCGGKDAHYGGKSIVSFHAALNDTKQAIAAREIYDNFIHPTIPKQRVRRWTRVMRQTPSIKKYIESKRLITVKFAASMGLGWDGERITMPVDNEFGIIVNAKRYDPAAKQKSTASFKVAKMLQYSDKKKRYMADGKTERKFGSPAMPYPFSSFKVAKHEGYIVVCEGEWDALFLCFLGIPAITSTNGSKSWPKQYNHMFRGLHVIIAYDNDAAGVMHKKKFVLPNLMKYAKSIKDLKIPKIKMKNGKVSKDVLDWAFTKKHMRRKEAWLNQFENKATLIIENDDKDIVYHDILHVNLDEASKGEYYHKKIKVRALVSGKINSPYVIPKKFRVSCAQREDCDGCPNKENLHNFKEHELREDDPEILKLLNVSDKTQREMLQKMCGFTKTTDACKCKVEKVSSFNIEELVVIPTLDSEALYTNRIAYYAGHGLESNKAYEFEGTTTANPRTQHAVHLFDKARPIQGEMDTFAMTEELYEQLKVFQPSTKETPLRKLMRIADWQSRNVTKIKERPDLHMAVDMSFHSVKEFIFNGEYVKRGMMDILILGDTRCGKGFVAEGLGNYYGLGTVASGENISFAGLIGGVQTKGNQFLITWGVGPLNNGRQVTIDEVSSMAIADIAKMSRVRSENVAEITKIISERTQAAVRWLWLSNPRSGKPIMSYNTGVEAIKELIGANEDISRFDLALTVASDEVSTEVINSLGAANVNDAGKYPAELCRQLILWMWSRTKEQVEFTPEAERAIIKQAIIFGKTYSSAIPLVQSENIRIKICKWAISVAGHLFSTDKTGEIIVIKAKHVKTACEIVSGFYDKESMNYRMFSAQRESDKSVTESDKLDKLFREYGKNKAIILDGLLRLSFVSTDALSDYVDGDNYTAKTLISALVQAKCLVRTKHGGYLKDKHFTHWLRDEIRGY